MVRAWIWVSYGNFEVPLGAFKFAPRALIFALMDLNSAFGVTDRAAARIAEIAAAEGKPALRVSVLAGGCSGFQYRFELDEAPLPDDLVIRQGPAQVLVDPVSLDLLSGAELDYTDELMGAHFRGAEPECDVGLRVRDEFLSGLGAGLTLTRNGTSWSSPLGTGVAPAAQRWPIRAPEWKFLPCASRRRLPLNPVSTSTTWRSPRRGPSSGADRSTMSSGRSVS